MKNKVATIVRAEQGQSLIIIAAVIVGLISLMGLAIDGGNLFMQRRRAQSASDAASLAGTRLLAEAILTCNADPDGSDTVIAREVNRFAESNGVSDTNGVAGDESNGNVIANYVDSDGVVLGQVGGGTLPAGSSGIQVDVKDDHKTYFISVVGIDTASVSAHAQAMTGAVTTFPRGGGILPFAIRDTVVEEFEEDDEIRALDVTNHHSGGFFCVDENGNGEYGDEEDQCVGDTAPHNAHRGWLNMNYIYNQEYLEGDDEFNRSLERNVPNRGCGSDPDRSTDDGLKGWASRTGDCPYPYFIIAGAIGDTNGDFIHGGPGARQSSLDALETTYEGHTAWVPVFDYIYTAEYMSEQFTAPEEPTWVEGANLGGDHWPRAGGGEHAFLYHIVGFAKMLITNTGGQGSDHYLDAVFEKAIIGDGAMVPDDDGFDPTVCRTPIAFGVALWD